MNDLITVIIPVYQVEKYLGNCVNSVLQQTYENLEIILVDDGSPDHCPQMCDEFATKDKRVRVIHKENGGLSDARNAGLDICTGKYVTFIDSDDYVTKNYVELLYSVLIDNDADISMVDAAIIYDSTPYCIDAVDGQVDIYTQKEVIARGLNSGNIQGWACGKLYRTEYFSDVRFPVGKLYEDLAIFYRIMLKIKKMAVVRAAGYKYLIRQGSIMHSSFNPRQLDEIEIVDQEMDNVVAHYPEYETIANGRRLYSYFVVLRRIHSSDNESEYEEVKKQLTDKIRFYSKKMLFKKEINIRLKSKILAFHMGEFFFHKWMDFVESTYPDHPKNVH